MPATTAPHLWLRAETKKNEHRTALTPSVVKSLLEAGFQITVEKSQESIFDKSEYAEYVTTRSSVGHGMVACLSMTDNHYLVYTVYPESNWSRQDPGGQHQRMPIL